VLLIMCLGPTQGYALFRVDSNVYAACLWMSAFGSGNRPELSKVVVYSSFLFHLHVC
jgi:hypothetical protein